MTSFLSRFSGNVINPTDVSLATISLTASIQLQWPMNNDPDLTSIGRITEVSASIAGLSIYLPPANQASVGEDVLVRNTGSEIFTVKDYAGVGVVISIGVGEAKYVYLADGSTEQGTWHSFSFGTGTSSADAAALAGLGLEADATKLNQAFPVTTFLNNYTVVDADRASFRVWTGGAGTLSLLAAAVLGDNWFIHVRNGGTGLLTIDCAGADLLNGAGSIGLQPNDSCFIVCSGTAFYTIGLGKSTQFNFSQLWKTVSSGTYTLSDSEAANTMLKFVSSGDLAGNVTIIVPPTLQVYYVQNSTTSPAGYTITISVGTGGSTTTLSAGQQASVINDSYNIVNANTMTPSLLDGTAANPSLYFGSEVSTGIYRPGAGKLGIAVLGVQVMDIAAALVTITNNVSITGTLASTGKISPAAGIEFPAVQNAIANVNTLDDYEEGTWSPSVGGTATYTSQVGKYTKIGDTVTVEFQLEINLIGTGSTTTLSGLPFANNNATEISFCAGYFTNSNVVTTVLGCSVAASASSITFNTLAAAAASMTLGSAVMRNSFSIRASFSYKI